MGNLKSEGFRYCQQDTDTFFDAKIRTLIARHGCDGYALWDYIKQAAYREHGYYMEWTEDRQDLASADLYMSYEKIGLILDYLLRRSLLVDVSGKSRSGVKVLTSHGIQVRFQQMSKAMKRSPIVEKSYWVLSEDETLDMVSFAQKSENSGMIGQNSGIKADNSGICEQKKIKEKEIKLNKKRERTFVPPTEEEVTAFCRENGYAVDAGRFVDYNNSIGWMVGNRRMTDWQASVRNWERRDAEAAKKAAAEAEKKKTEIGFDLDEFFEAATRKRPKEEYGKKEET